jgi:LacI family transcriptional regulator, repressor for deo operon, udp, cdd, tsx, nupC, and nupG
MTEPSRGESPMVALSIEDVAAEAGVSTATVSRALRDLPSVAPKTRDRVVDVARRLGYVVSPSAASLASGRTRTIGLLTPWINRWFFGNVIDGAERALRAVGYDALLYTFNLGREHPRLGVDPRVLRRRVDGILVVGLPLSRKEVASLADLDVPLAFVGTGHEDHLTVRLDDVGVGRAATEHLLGLGHRRIGHVTAEPEAGHAPGALEAGHSWSPPLGREQGWRSALAEAGIVPHPGWRVVGAFGMEGGRAATHELLDAHPDLTGIVAVSDEMAMGVSIAAQERDLAIPDQLSVVGVDGINSGKALGLTTISQDPESHGRIAAELLLRLMDPEVEYAQSDKQILCATHLVVRRSTAAPSR